MKIKKPVHSISLIIIASLLSAVSNAAIVTFDFNTTGDTKGFYGLGGIDSGRQSIGIDGTSGVFTSNDIVSNDPQIGFNGVATLGEGETWSTFTFRFRQLNSNPGDVGVAPVAFDSNGTLIFFNGSVSNIGNAISTDSYGGSGAYAGDTYVTTLTAEANGEWQLFTIDLSNAPTLSSENITTFRFDPLGNNDTKNFEIDYVTFTSVPEPSAALLGFLGMGLLFHRRK